MGNNVKSLFDAHGGRHSSQSLMENWKDYVGAVKKVDENFTDEKALRLSLILETTKRELDRYQTNLLETTQPPDVGPFKKHAFDLLTAVMTNLIAEDIVSVQPIQQKVGQVFYLKYLYGSDKGGISRGDEIASPHVVSPQGYDARHYSSEIVEGEIIGDSSDSESSGNFAYTPIRPGTVRVSVGSNVLEDDGEGDITGSGLDSGSIDYATGAYVLDWASNAGDEVTVDYEFDLESVPSTIPQVDLKVEERIMQARSRKLRALYAFDAAYDLKMSQGLDIDDALLEAVGTEIKHEIDAEIMNDLYTQAGLSSTWDLDRPSGISQREHRETFISEISSAGNSIFQSTRRAVGNFAVLGKVGADVLESLGEPRYKPSGVTVQAGPHFAGTLDGRWKIYKNPYFNEDQYLVGYKGDMFLDAGYVYAPYLPIFATSLLMMDDFIGRRGFATSYAKKMLNNNLYVSGTITST